MLQEERMGILLNAVYKNGILNTCDLCSEYGALLKKDFGNAKH
jgi:hypothetical protein